MIEFFLALLDLLLNIITFGLWSKLQGARVGYHLRETTAEDIERRR